MATRFAILGALEVWSDDRRVLVAGTRHQRVLVMLLLSANRVVPLDRLVDAAWDDEPPATAGRQVRKIVANLRRLVPDGPELINTESPGYRAVLTTDQLDLDQFTSQLNLAVERAKNGDQDGRAVALRAALALWRGPVLGGFGGRVIDAVSAGLDERRLVASEQLLELRLDQGEARELIDELRELVDQQPMRESLRGTLMTALYRSGRQADALAEYNALRSRLADDLGIDPSRELVALYERILRNSPDLDQPAAAPVASAAAPTEPSARSLPYDLPDFVGRSAELEELLLAHDRPDNPATVLSINGMGGSGKTALAVHAAHLFAPNYPDGQLFVDLHGFTEGRHPIEPAEALDILLTGAGRHRDQIPHDLAGRISLWRTIAATRKLLIVLDNAMNSAQVQPLLPGTRGCLTLITSRTYLAGLDGAFRLTLGLLTEQESLDLLASTLGSHRVAAEPEAAHELVRWCGRLPLALRIAGARLHNRPHWNINHLVSRLGNTEARIDELAVEHRSVANTIGLSYTAMRPNERTLFRQLGMVPVCDFDGYVAAAIADRPLAQTTHLLEALLDARLLEPLGSTRYTLHDLVRSYARALATESQNPDLLRTRIRVLEYYIWVAGTAATVLRPDRPDTTVMVSRPATDIPPIESAVAALDWFDAERANILGAVNEARRGGLHEHARDLAGHLSKYLELRGHYDRELTDINNVIADV